MFPAIAAAGAALGALQIFGETANALRAGIGVVGSAQNVASQYKLRTHGSSLVDITQSARVQPLCVVDARLVNQEFMTDIMQTALSLFTAYYMQAVEIITNINDISVAERLQALNPTRRSSGASVFESYDRPLVLSPDLTLSEEAYRFKLPQLKRQADGSFLATESAMIGNKDMVNLSEAANLAVGKLFNVTIQEGEQKACVKVAIRLDTKVVPTSTMLTLLTIRSQADESMGERWHGVMSGRLEFWRDFVFCRDIIAQHRNAMIRDKTGTYAQIVNRENTTLKAGMFSKNPSLNTASNILVTSNDMITQVERKLAGKMSDMRFRNTIFGSTNLMLLFVVDEAFNRVTLYTRGISDSTSLSFKDIKAIGKDSGPNVTDLLKAYISGASPQF